MATVLVKPVITEKSTRLGEKNNTYAFRVDKTANKLEIKKSIEAYYNVQVENVNTTVNVGKKKVRYTKKGIAIIGRRWRRSSPSSWAAPASRPRARWTSGSRNGCWTCGSSRVPTRSPRTLNGAAPGARASWPTWARCAATSPTIPSSPC